MAGNSAEQNHGVDSHYLLCGWLLRLGEVGVLAGKIPRLHNRSDYSAFSASVVDRWIARVFTVGGIGRWLYRVSDNVGLCQVFFERTPPCPPKSAPFRSS